MAPSFMNNSQQQKFENYSETILPSVEDKTNFEKNYLLKSNTIGSLANFPLSNFNDNIKSHIYF